MKQFDAVVIGSGPGGYVCAIRLAQLGKKTAIIEREFLGGVCLNVGCIPSKALIYASSQYWKIKNDFGEMGLESKSTQMDIAKLQAWKSGVVNKLTSGVGNLLKMNGAEIIRGEARFVGPKSLEVKTKAGTEKISAHDFVIATGSRVSEIPFLKTNGKNIITSTEALALAEVPERFVVVGGGFIGLEIGTLYAKLGSRVTIVEAMDQLLPSTDKELVTVVEKRLKVFGVTVMVQTKVVSLEEKEPLKAKSLRLTVEGVTGGKKAIEADCILVSVGRKPNSDGAGLETIGVKLDPRGNVITDQQGKTNVPSVWAIGDVTGPPQLAHRAMMDGLLVAAGINGEKSYRDYKTVPWVVFSDPEIAACGYSEKELVERGVKYKVGRFPFAASGRALSTSETDGFMKVLIDEKNEAILGVHIVGHEASNLIAEATLAIEMGATAEDIIRTIHSHPTLPEAFPESIEAALGKAIHIFKPASRKPV
ncbi:MAG: dihydrolipoyl dehydrogenase [Deltaproteobacteria bacterium]|nr:dihydrolipoyl dehydrogenase [Deltaproteobacteria bacterium]MBI3293760.1 dihydrolipoyl dehydrogenase [Deltaproteobacteria bacterium]